MAMSVLQVRLPDRLIEAVEDWVKRGFFSSKSDFVRYAIRRELLKRMIGTMPNTGDSVKEVRAIRKKLSKEPIDIEELNKLLD